MAFDTFGFTANIGALNNAVRPVVKTPADGKGGGWTLLEAECVQGGAGTVNINIIDMGTGGTAAEGTIATMGSTVFAANTPQAFTMATSPFSDGGDYIGVEELNVGACDTVTIVSFKFVRGK
jgi:hypothetical protein